MKKLKTWLLERFLPAWAKDTVYQDNKRRSAFNEDSDDQ